MNKRAVVLLSGGLDSATTLAIAKSEGFDCYCMAFRYGQRHAVELQSALTVSKALGAEEFRIVDIDLAAFGGSALVGDGDVPKDREGKEMSSGIPVTYVPARNTIFLSFALGWAEVMGAFDLFIGVNAVDYSGYPDCRPEFVAAYQTLANLATKAGVEGKRFTIHTPLIELTKAEIITKGTGLGVDYGLTYSCYDPDKYDLACGHCDSCLLRKKGFAEAGIADPTRYGTGA